MGLYVPALVWRELLNFSAGSICLVMASEFYDPADYFRDYADFREGDRRPAAVNVPFLDLKSPYQRAAAQSWMPPTGVSWNPAGIFSARKLKHLNANSLPIAA